MQCHPELACLAAIGKSMVGMTERASTACPGSWCEGSCEEPRVVMDIGRSWARDAVPSVTLRAVNKTA
jgi:hypothetical protein